MNLLNHILGIEAFDILIKISEEKNIKIYAVGGYVRDVLLGKKPKNIDIVVEGNGLDLAKIFAKRIGTNIDPVLYKNFGTAMVKYKDWEIEFVGARKESYRTDSRKPNVVQGTLEDDIKRRDFTINTMLISLNKSNLGELIDMFDGFKDLENKLIKTPLDPVLTYSDDPLRMMRAIRFASVLNFNIEEKSYNAIKEVKERIKIISKERITEELNKILMSDKPSIGLRLLYETGLLEIIFPKLNRLSGVEVINGHGHKDILFHTFEVVDNLSKEGADLWLRWAGLLHDIGKGPTKKYVENIGWTFYNHDYIGSKMIPQIFVEMKLPQNEKMRYVQKLTELHLRPASLVEDIVTDSAIRRLLFDAGELLDDLMKLCKADITSKNILKVKKYRENFENVKNKIREIEEKDRIRNMKLAVNGEDIMEWFGLAPSKEIGILKNLFKEAVLDGLISNDREEGKRFLIDKAKKMNIYLKNIN